jgi:hypothetical protein
MTLLRRPSRAAAAIPIGDPLPDGWHPQPITVSGRPESSQTVTGRRISPSLSYKPHTAHHSLGTPCDIRGTRLLPLQRLARPSPCDKTCGLTGVWFGTYICSHRHLKHVHTTGITYDTMTLHRTGCDHRTECLAMSSNSLGITQLSLCSRISLCLSLRRPCLRFCRHSL